MDKAEALRLIRLSVTLATETAQKFSLETNGRDVPIVAGSVGPYGACCHDGSEYHGNYVDHMTTEELIEWHRPRVRELLSSGADILACETIPSKVCMHLLSRQNTLRVLFKKVLILVNFKILLILSCTNN